MVPATTDLAIGELAINTVDGLLFLKTDDGLGNQAVVTVGAGSKGVCKYAVGERSYVLATGKVGDVTLETNLNTAKLILSNGATLVSASIYFSSDQMVYDTNVSIDWGSDLDNDFNTSFDTMSVPQFQVWADSGSRPFKVGAAGTIPDTPHVMIISGLIMQEAIWVNLSF